MNVSGTPSTNLTTVHFQSDYSAYDLLCAGAFILMIIISICGNGTVFWVMTRSQLRHKPCSVLMCSLAASDIGVTVTTMPMRILEFLSIRFPRPLCIVWIASDVLVSGSSILTLLGIAIERYLSVVYAYRHGNLISKSSLIKAVSAIWIISVSVAVFSIFNWTNKDYFITQSADGKCIMSHKDFIIAVYIAVFFLPLICISVIYITLFTIARSKSQEAPSKSTNKTFITVVMIYGAFITCWLPNAVIVMLHTFQPEVLLHLQKNPKLFRTIYYVCVMFLPPMNSMINPLIYGVYSSAFRHATKNLISQAQFRRSAKKSALRRLARQRKECNGTINVLKVITGRLIQKETAL